MIRYEKVHLIGLIGLRALAEYDIAEFNRATSFSKRQLEEKIKNYLNKIVDSESKLLYQDFVNSSNVSENTQELHYLMKQINSTCTQKSQHLALQLARLSPKGQNYKTSFNAATDMPPMRQYASNHDDITRLGVMLLLKKLINYNVEFNYKIKDLEIDALLIPTETNMPHIVIETKTRVDVNIMKAALKHLSLSMKLFGKNALGILLTPNQPESNARILFSDRMFYLIFDKENNVFEPNSEDLFMSKFNAHSELDV